MRTLNTVIKDGSRNLYLSLAEPRQFEQFSTKDVGYTDGCTPALLKRCSRICLSSSKVPEAKIQNAEFLKLQHILHLWSP